MSHALAALVRAYEQSVARTLALPQIGLPGCVRLGFTDFKSLPPAEIEDFNRQTKDPTIMCVERMVDGRMDLLPLASRVSGAGRNLVASLVRRGIHPLDIVIATWSSDTDDFTFRSAVEHLFWTSDDQAVLEREARAA